MTGSGFVTYKDVELEEWKNVLYNGLETNIQVTSYGEVRRVLPTWSVRNNGKWKHKLGNVDLSKLKTNKGYSWLSFMIKGDLRKHAGVHQLVAAAFLGYQFDGMKTVVHHKDFNKLNNNVNNLKIVTNRENCSIEKTIKSGLPVGVYYDKERNKYESYLKVDGKKKQLGRFNTIEEASMARTNALKQLT